MLSDLVKQMDGSTQPAVSQRRNYAQRGGRAWICTEMVVGGSISVCSDEAQRLLFKQ